METCAMRVRVYDNGGKTCDRYTVVYQYGDGSADVRTMSDLPDFGVNQFWYSEERWRYRRWMGKKVKWSDLNDMVQRAICNSAAWS